ncbi:MAG: hypothetical protein ACOYM3_28440, partial [Terrimicrobiaceae bacterium]
MTSPLRIGFLPFYVDYYEAISADLKPRKLELIQQCRDALKGYGTVLGPDEPLMTKEAALAAGEAMRQEGVDCVVALTVIAVFADVSDAAVQALDAPLLVWHCQEIDTVGDDYSMVEIVRNTGQIGVQALANVLRRRGRLFQALSASRHSPKTREGLEDFFSVARARRALLGARILQVGEPFPDMSDVFLSAAHCQTLQLKIKTL